MTLWKPALGLAMALALTACDAPAPLTQVHGVSAAPIASRADRTPGSLTENDIVQAVMSSL